MATTSTINFVHFHCIRARVRRARTLVRLVRGLRRHIRHDWRPMGHILAPLHRARHVLDAGPHGHLPVRRAGGPFLRLPDPGHHFRQLLQLRSTAVKMWGFEAPLGAFIAAWGGVAMLTSAPFDNWWHSAYGLDVKILSPPHVLLILGNLAVNTGTLILILGMMNRARR